MFRRFKIRPQNLIFVGLISFSLWILHGLTLPATSLAPPLFGSVVGAVSEHFYDPNFNGVDWTALAEDYRPQVEQDSSLEARAVLINQMLDELQTSHTHLYTVDDPGYYQLLGIFYPRINVLRDQLRNRFPDGKVSYVGIGIVTHQIEGKTFIKAIFDDSPAATAGLQVGDEILSVAGQPFHPIQSFLDKAGQPVSLQIQRSPDASSQQALTVTPQQYDGITMFLDAMAESIEVIETSGHQIGYIHIWSYAGDQYQQKLEEELMYGQLKDVDALVLDLRDGWGGAPLTALNFFTAQGPSLTSIDREGTAFTHQAHWDKPVVMLVNEGSRSGKEVLAYSFQQYNVGPIVGSLTAGAVVAGRPLLMPEGTLLYLAVADVYLDDDVRLEGVGVTPDVVVPFPIEYAQGADPQKEQAIATALQTLEVQ